MNLAPTLGALLLVASQLGWYDERARRIETERLYAGKPAEIKEALRLLKEMDQKAAEEKDPHWRMYALWRRGSCEAQLGDFATARKSLEEAVKSAPPDKNDMLYFVRRELGEVYLRHWAVEKAKPHLEWAQAQEERLIRGSIRFKAAELGALPETEPVRLRLLLGQCPLTLGENKKARVEHLAIEKTINDRTKEARQAGRPLPLAWLSLSVECQFRLAELDRRRGDTISAIERLQAVLAEVRDLKSPLGYQFQFNAHLELAMHYRNLAQYGAVRAELDRARKMLREDILTERNEADLEGARAAFLVEQVTFALAAEKGVAGLIEQLDQAEKLVRTAVARSARGPEVYTAGLVHLLAQIHDHRARVHGLRGETKKASPEQEQASQRYDQAVRLWSVVLPPYHDLVLQTRRHRAELALRRGEVPAARKEASEAFALYATKHKEDDVGRGDFYRLLLEIEYRARNPKAALVHAAKLRKLSSEGLVGYLAGWTTTEQIKFFRQWDDPGLHASLRLGVHYEEAREFSLECLINGKAKIAEVLAQANHHDRGGEEHEQLRRSVQRQAYLLYGRSGEKPEDLAEELLKEEAVQQQLRRAALKKRALLKAGPPGGRPEWHTLADLRKGIAADEVYLDVFCLRPEENAARAYYAWVVAAKGPVSVVKLGDAAAIDKGVEEFVQHQEGLLQKRFKLTDEDLGALREDRVPEAVLGKLQGIVDKEFSPKQFREQLTRALQKDELRRYQGTIAKQARFTPFTQFGPLELERNLRRECLKPLSDLLLTPKLLLATAGHKRWIVSPDGPLWGLPWGALIWPGNDKYAVEEITFRYEIAGRDLVPTAPRKIAAGEPWVLASPDLERVPAKGVWLRRAEDDPLLLEDLKAARAEGQEVANALKRFFAGEARPQKDNSTKEDLLNLTKAPRIVYLSTHAFSPMQAELQVSDPLLSCGIAFAGINQVPVRRRPPTPAVKGLPPRPLSLPGLLTGAEVLATDLRGTELVVLSACQSGKGETPYGQSPADLRHTFHLAGARAVVSSLWSVEDKHTRLLMVSFTEALSRRNLADKADALNRAQRKMIEQLREDGGERHAHPFFWAAFTLSGS